MASHLVWLVCATGVQVNTPAGLNIWLSAGSASAKRWFTSLCGAEGPKGPAAHSVKLWSAALIFAAICWPALKLTHQQRTRGRTSNPLWKHLWKRVVDADFCCKITNHSTLICVYLSPLLNVYPTPASVVIADSSQDNRVFITSITFGIIWRTIKSNGVLGHP